MKTRAERIEKAARLAEEAFRRHFNAESEAEQGKHYEKLVERMLDLRKALRS